MRKYIVMTLAVIFAANSQTVLFAKEASKKGASSVAFEQFVSGEKLNTKYFSSLLSDTSSVSLEKILLSPEQRVYNDLTKALSSENNNKTFKENINKVNKKAIVDSNYAQAVPDAYYKVYLDVVNNPNVSADFNLTEQELTKVIKNYQDKIVNLLRDSYAFQIEKRQNPNLTLSAHLNKIINKNIDLLSQYVKANPNIKLYDCQEEKTTVAIKQDQNWPNTFVHQKMLIEAAALRVIEASLKQAKAGITYDFALFDIISISRATANETQVSFNNGALNFTLPQDAYLYVPFGVLKLVSRDAKFKTALQEIEQKKINPSYSFSGKKGAAKRDNTHQDIKDLPYGSTSIR